jgi:hypothetical protein
MALGKLKALVPRTLNNVCHSCQSEISIGRQSAQIKGPRVPKKVQFTQKLVEYNVFLFDDPLKGSKSLKIFKINLTFRFDKL